MTTTTHTSPAALASILRETLDDACSFFRTPPQVTIVRCTASAGVYFHILVTNTKGDIVCIDSHLRSRIGGNLRYNPGRGYTLPPEREPHLYVFGALTAMYGADYANTVTVKEVR